jgi:hypothetical protein
MSAIHAVPSEHKMAWRGGDFTKDGIAFDLTACHAAALEKQGRVRRHRLPAWPHRRAGRGRAPTGGGRLGRVAWR